MAIRLLPRTPTVPRPRGRVALPDGRTDMVEGATVGELYEQAEALGGELVEVSPGGAPAEWLGGTAA